VPAGILRWPLAAAALLLASALVWYWLIGTPQYSAYLLAAALRDRDAAAAERFVDIRRVARSASDVIVVEYLTREPKAAQALESLGQGGARPTAARAIEPLVAARVQAEIRRMADSGGSGPGAFALPASLIAVLWQPQVTRDGDDVWLSYPDHGGGRTRFKVSPQGDRTWAITEFDREWVRRHLRELSGG
jgi:hypothetical protein